MATDQNDLDALKRTKSLLSSMVLGATGWEQQKFIEEHAGKPRVFLYLHDVAKGWTWMASVVRESFVSVSEKSLGDPQSAEMAIAGVNYLAGNAADGIPLKAIDGDEWEQQLGTLLAIYAGNTVTWENAGRFHNGGHFVVILYRKEGSNKGFLRPFAAIADDNTPMPADELLDAVKQVVQIDSVRHPDWVQGLRVG